MLPLSKSGSKLPHLQLNVVVGPIHSGSPRPGHVDVVFVGEVEHPAAGHAELEGVAVDEFVHHLVGERDVAARAGPAFGGGEGVGASLLDGPPVALALVFLDEGFGVDDGLVEPR